MESTYQISFQINTSFYKDDAYQGLTEINGYIKEESSDEVVGEISMYLVKRFNEDNNSLEMLFDANDHLSQYINWIKDEEDNGFDNIPFFSKVLVIDYIKISKKHRGNNLSLYAIYQIMNLFGPEEIISILIPSAMQFNGDAPLSKEFKNIEKIDADKKLEEHYKKIGYIPIPSYNLMLLDGTTFKSSINNFLE
ncbi:MAG: hypothetical protein COB67_02490 [SAR324 cluster bacterium]|uniref:N-acetyltransferase domain-containing protein n=1 Tax=SAR324 cluster bacterium TaxID=2024889 RepID=A0A2A4T9G2_9DELT|nr:MAG: hypothetical protein COB67_02490 [SAR324 cluster bacterium]